MELLSLIILQWSDLKTVIPANAGNQTFNMRDRRKSGSPRSRG